MSSGLRSTIPNSIRSFTPTCWRTLACIALVLIPIAAQAATISGTVLDPSGSAVPRAQVTLFRGLEVLDQKQTTDQGVYKFEGVKDGAYQLSATAPGEASSKVDVQVTLSHSPTLDLHLQLTAVQKQVLVSASLADVPANETGSTVTVVSGQDIQDRAAVNLLEVLPGIPGVEVSQSGRYGGVTGVYVRGGQSNYNLVMIDGIEVNEFGGSFDFAPLPADGIQSVEVTRGPESALYGPNAVTSVVNIVTTEGDGTPHFSLEAEGGNFTTRRFVGGGSGETKGISWAFDLSRFNTGGLVTNDNYRDQSIFLSLGYHRSVRRRLDFHFLGNANDAGAPGPYGSDPDHLFTGIDTYSRDKQNLFGWGGNYSEQINSRFRQVSSIDVSTNDYYFRSPFGDSYSNNLRAVANTRSEVTVSRTDSFVAGFEYNREQTENTFIADASNTPFVLPRTSLAFFAENRWNPIHRLFITAGFRVDDLRTDSLPPDAFGERPSLPPSDVAKFNPRVAAAYMLRESHGGAIDGTRLHASFGTGIRPPDGFNLAFTDNPNLKPETSISVDAGVEQRFVDGKAVLDLTFFDNHFRDQIVTLGGSLTNLSSFVSANLGNSLAQGMELSFKVHPLTSLEVGAEYTLDRTEVQSLDGSSLALAPLEVGQALLNEPRNSAGFDVTWRHRNLMLNTNAYIRGQALDVEPNFGLGTCQDPLPCQFEDAGYFRWDGGFSYRLPKGFEIFGRMDNLLDRKYEEVLGYPSLPFNFLAGVRYSFTPRSL